MKVKQSSPAPAPKSPDSAPARGHASTPAPAPARPRDSFKSGGQPWEPQIPQTGVATNQSADEGGHDWKGPKTKKEQEEAEKKLREAKVPPFPQPPQARLQQQSTPRQPHVVGAAQPEPSDEGGHDQRPAEKPAPKKPWYSRFF